MSTAAAHYVNVTTVEYLDGYKLQELRYSLKLQVIPELAMPPHRALPDAYLCGELLIRLPAQSQ